MPPVLTAIAAAALSEVSITAAGSLAFGTLSSFLARAALGIVLGFAAQALSPKPKSSSADFSDTANGLTTNSIASIDTRKLVYGLTRVGGTIGYIGGTNNNTYLHMVVMVAAHEVQSIDEVWFDDVCIPIDALDADGNVTVGRFAGKARIRKHLGSPTQLADTAMVAEIPEWTADHRLQEIAYLSIRLQYDQGVYPGGIPTSTAFVKGRKLFDPRIGAGKFSTNAVLFQYDYIGDVKYGFNDMGLINQDVASAGANICDEFVDVADVVYPVNTVTAANNTISLTCADNMLDLVIGDKASVDSSGTVPGGLSDSTDYYIIPYQFRDNPRVQLALSLDDALAGIAVDITSAGSGTITITKTAEPRYHGAGVIDTANTLKSNMDDMLTATGGRAYFIGGQWLIRPAAWQAPIDTIEVGDIVGDIVTRTALTYTDRFNAVKGVYRSEINLDEPSDWPALVSDEFADEDGETIYTELDTPFNGRPQQSRRVAKIELLRSRREKVMQIPCNLTKFGLQAGATVYVNIPRYGFSNKIFEITNFALVPSGSTDNPTVAVQLQLRETFETDFDWSTSEEAPINPSDGITLPNVHDVAAVSGLRFDSIPQQTRDGDIVYLGRLKWSPHADAFVQSGGSFHIYFKKSTDILFQSYPPVPGIATQADIFTASLGDAYDIQIIAYNNIGVPSSPVILNGVVAGGGGGVGATLDYGNFHTSPTTSLDYGDFHTTPTTFLDYESFV